MKKILLIFLFILITSCTNKKEKALENCADSMFVDSFSEDDVLIVLNQNLIKVNPYFNKWSKMGSRLLDLEILYNSQQNKLWTFDDETKLRADEAKKANVPDTEIERFLSERREEAVKLSQELYGTKWDIKTLKLKQKRYIFENKRDIIKKGKITQKFNLKNYAEMHEFCEQEYNKFPDTFLIKFKNSKL